MYESDKLRRAEDRVADSNSWAPAAASFKTKLQQFVNIPVAYCILCPLSERPEAPAIVVGNCECSVKYAENKEGLRAGLVFHVVLNRVL